MNEQPNAVLARFANLFTENTMAGSGKSGGSNGGGSSLVGASIVGSTYDDYIAGSGSYYLTPTPKGTKKVSLTNSTSGHDTIHGNSGNDTIYALGGHDLLYGEQGNDFLYGEVGNDTLDGGDDDDFLVGGAGNDTLVGGAGIDTAAYHYYSSGGYVVAALGLNNGVGHATVFGGATDIDQLDYSVENLKGGTGNDQLIGNELTNFLWGGSGDDTLLGLDGNDTIAGESGRDNIWGGNGNDLLYGHNGGAGVNDTLPGGDALYGEAGNDTLDGGHGGDYLDGGAENDLLFGQSGDDTLFGGDGNDTLNGGSGNDRIDGGADEDTVVFLGDLAAYSFSGDASDATINGPDGIDAVIGVEHFKFADGTWSASDLLAKVKVYNGAHLVAGFSTINEAIISELTQTGYTLKVSAGSYAETVNVSKDVTILGANAGIAGTGSRGAESIVSGGFHVTADGVTLDGLQISQGAVIAGETAGVYVAADGVTVTNMVIARTGSQDN